MEMERESERVRRGESSVEEEEEPTKREEKGGRKSEKKNHPTSSSPSSTSLFSRLSKNVEHSIHFHLFFLSLSSPLLFEFSLCHPSLFSHPHDSFAQAPSSSGTYDNNCVSSHKVPRYKRLLCFPTRLASPLPRKSTGG